MLPDVEAFLEAGHLLLQHRSASSSRLSLDFPDLPGKPAYTLKPGQPSPGQHSLRPPLRSNTSTGILTCFPSTTPFGLALGVDSPCRLTLDRNPWSSLTELFTRFIVTYVSIRTSDTSSIPHSTPSQAYQNAPCPTHSVAAAASVHGLAPLHLPRRPTRPVSYYAFFK